MKIWVTRDVKGFAYWSSPPAYDGELFFDPACKDRGDRTLGDLVEDMGARLTNGQILPIQVLVEPPTKQG